MQTIKNFMNQSLIPNVKNSVLVTAVVVIAILTYIIPKNK